VHLLVQANALRIPLADKSVHMCVTSPPYWGLRDYGVSGQLGLEPTPDEFIRTMTAVFREVWRVLRDDGTCWVNMGDSYASSGASSGWSPQNVECKSGQWNSRRAGGVEALKPKDLCMIPARFAMALQADGWWLRDKITWAKAEIDEDDRLEGSAMPGSQGDRCTSASEEIFMFTKSERYYFDLEGCKTKSGATLRNVWRMNTEATKAAHFATFPRELPRRAILLGTSQKGCCPSCGKCWTREVESERVQTRPGTTTKTNGVHVDVMGNRDPGRHATTKTTTGWHAQCACGEKPVPCVVLDPFSGTATSGVVANELGRHYIGLDLSPEYIMFAQRRIERPHAPIKRKPHQGKPTPLFREEKESA
jgi:DNA modification methylase